MRRVTILIAVLALGLAACSGDGDSDTSAPIPTDAPTDAPQGQNNDGSVVVSVATVTPAPDAPSTPEPMDDTGDETAAEAQPETAAYNGPSWTALELTNARTGETFTFADFAGRTVFVHPMATWCTNCRASQSSIRDSVLPVIGGNSDIVFVSINVETNVTGARLAGYAEDNGFPWTFAVITPQLLAEWTRYFGSGVSNPPIQPHFIINPDGTTTDLLTGQESPQNLIDDLLAAGA